MQSEDEIRKLLKEYFYCERYSLDISNGKASIYGKQSKVTLIKTTGGFGPFKITPGELPVKFDIVAGNFNCTNGELTTLVGCPNKVMGSFECGQNRLTNNLIGGPATADDYICSRTNISSFDGGPRKVGSLFAENNQITSLEGAPIVSGYFSVTNNKLKNLIGLPDVKFTYLAVNNNKLETLEGLTKNINEIKLSWNSRLGLLRLVPLESKIAINRKDIQTIITKYQGQLPFKKAILDCQKALIDAGYVGNASW
jgi:hypothetical protein